jgi:hypothetical protein
VGSAVWLRAADGIGRLKLLNAEVAEEKNELLPLPEFLFWSFGRAVGESLTPSVSTGGEVSLDVVSLVGVASASLGTSLAGTETRSCQGALC